MVFRRQRDHNYSPSADDLAMGPCRVMYQMLLLYWNELERESNTTYRKMKVKPHEADMYTKGTKFVWQSVVSPALERRNTQAFATQGPSGETRILYYINNSTPCIWQPRNIEALGYFSETERTYPAGAKYLVTDKGVVNAEVHVKLRLLAK
ncbi:hypothetical protein DPMN_026482 [Dreissena polymorpha]|uniref:Uncharacterized protein n=1 Tax=Dreissena polymorpha TaxID=45954 RepID=A0A9D4LTG5_DREPO|nr:hypothetical protein DPMN_026482 [Dreissena polymorpha]